jgi:hypothetical protein
MNNVEKLNQLYIATRIARLTSDEHDILRKTAEELYKVIESVGDGENVKTPPAENKD